MILEPLHEAYSATLTSGTYYLYFSSESSMSKAFTSRLSLV